MARGPDLQSWTRARDVLRMALTLYSLKSDLWRRRRCFTLVMVLACLTILGTGVSLQSGMYRQKFFRQSPTFPLIPVTPLNMTLFNRTNCSILRTMRTGARNTKLIEPRMPKIFHQTYKNTMLPSAYLSQIAKCRNLNPDWEYYLWRDEDIETFMAEHFPSYRQKYHKFTMNVQRADFIRYMVLYHYGGVYLDMDVECVKPFFPSLENHLAFLDQERKEHAQILYNEEFMAMNSVMGSVAGHPFYLRMLESVVNADDKLILAGAGHSTGPDRLTAVYREWARDSECMREFPVTLMEPAMFSPIADTKLHNFHDICKEGKNRNKKWFEAGCRLLTVKNWRRDATDGSTVGKHLFLHLGYNWGPRSTNFFDAAELGPVKLYRSDRMLS